MKWTILILIFLLFGCASSTDMLVKVHIDNLEHLEIVAPPGIPGRLQGLQGLDFWLSIGADIELDKAWLDQ